MALFQDWIDELLKDPFANEVARDTEKDLKCCSSEYKNTNKESCNEYKDIVNKRLNRWPYSTFLDWSLDPYNSVVKGFLPDILQKNIGVSTSSQKPGLVENTYFVNSKYIFFGLNPSRKLNELPIRDHLNPSELQDTNDGNFINFTLASEYGFRKWKSYTSWKQIGSFVKSFDLNHRIGKKALSQTSPQTIYSKFHGSYITDIAPLLSVPKIGEARKCLEADPLLRSKCFSMVKRELKIYKDILNPKPKDMTIFCLGRSSTFIEVSIFAATIGKGLFPGARIIEVGHYSQGNHLKLINELDCILRGGKPKFESVWS